MASISTVVSRSLQRNPARPLCIGVLVALIVVSYKLFSAEPESNVFRPQGQRFGSSESSNVSPATTRKRLVNIVSKEDEEDAAKENKQRENEINEGGVIEDNTVAAKINENIADLDKYDTEPDKKSTKDGNKVFEKQPAEFKDTEKKGSDEFLVGRYNVMMTLVKVTPESFLAKMFRKCVKSICEHASISLTFQFIVDTQASQVIEDIFSKMSGKCKPQDVVYHDVEKLANMMDPALINTMQNHFTAGAGSYYSGAIFFLSTVLHQLFPAKLTKVIMLDSDLRFSGDIKMLFDYFTKFQPSTIMGLVAEQSPVYRHTFERHRKANPGTGVGEPPPKGITGYNSGVVLVNLENMHKSRVYQHLIRSQAIDDIVQKYQFKGHLGDQDFFSVLSIDHPELFLTIPCGWNRQLCKYWKENGYADVFDLYFNCSKPIHVYHGNCRSAIPGDSQDD